MTTYRCWSPTLGQTPGDARSYEFRAARNAARRFANERFAAGVALDKIRVFVTQSGPESVTHVYDVRRDATGAIDTRRVILDAPPPSAPSVPGLTPDVLASHRYVESVSHTADYPKSRTWHGWALREAFLAGIAYARTVAPPEQRRCEARFVAAGEDTPVRCELDVDHPGLHHSGAYRWGRAT